MYPSCQTCKNLKRGDRYHPDGHVEQNVTVCIDRKCETGLNTFYRPVV